MSNDVKFRFGSIAAEVNGSNVQAHTRPVSSTSLDFHRIRFLSIELTPDQYPARVWTFIAIQPEMGAILIALIILPHFSSQS
jgi:hypothetical protein